MAGDTEGAACVLGRLGTCWDRQLWGVHLLWGWEVLGSGEEKSGTRQRAQDTSQHLAGTRWAPGEHRAGTGDRSQISPLVPPPELLKRLSCRAHSHAQRSLWLPIRENRRSGATHTACGAGAGVASGPA